MIDQTDNGLRRFIAWISVAILIIAADQATKWAIIEWVPLYDKVPVNSFLNLTHQQNRGAAFSFLANESGWQRWFFVVLASAVSFLIVAADAQSMVSCRNLGSNLPNSVFSWFSFGVKRLTR